MVQNGLYRSDVWQSIGWSAIIYIAALSAVDQELYEAATIDGASRIQKNVAHIYSAYKAYNCNSACYADW